MQTLDEKLISDFITLGCTRRNAAATSQVYLELCEVRRLYDINYHFNDTLKRMYLTARESKSAPMSVYLPVCTSENISLNNIKSILTLNPTESVNLAIISPDSTCVYYQISSGLANIESANTNSLDKRKKRDIEIINKRSEIEAVLNLPSPSTSEL